MNRGDNERGLDQLVDGLVDHDEDLRRMVIVKPKGD